MANFNTHIAVSTGASCFATVVCTSYFSLPVMDASILFILGAMAGLLPDIDSDHSIPIRWMFRIITLAVMFLIIILVGSSPLLHLIAYLCAAVLLMYCLIIPLFKQITVHRGLFHSVPAALLFGLATLCIGQYVFMWTLLFSWLAAAFVCAGYILHLLLDEISSVDLLNGQIKGSFGSALTLISPASWPAYCVLYSAVLIGFLYLPMPNVLEELSHNMFAILTHLNSQ
ncbi:MAG: metal-dependent hydrolase [Mariprofundaceae bacterium]|nr:metal-dependent hydrolase [Mariprofundaceae bacterium]